MSQEPKKEGAVFTCTMPFTSYVFKNGKRIQFTGHNYYTENREEIQELRAEAQNPDNIFIDEDTSEKAKDYLDPMGALKAKIIAEYEAQKKADVKLGASSYGSEPAGNSVNPTTTETLVAAAESDSAPVREIKIGK